MKEMKKFPPRSAFKSTLKGDALPSLEDYIAAKREYYRRKLLPKNHPEKIKSMYGWLKYYNIVDVMPLAVAIENSFRSYHAYFQVNAMTSLSLPGLAEQDRLKYLKKK